MYAQVTLAAGEPHAVLAVPSAAVQEIDGKPVVFVRTAKGAFERRDVTVGTRGRGLGRGARAA